MTHPVQPLTYFGSDRPVEGCTVNVRPDPTPSETRRSARPWIRPDTPLTDRELSVLDLASRGLTNARIGARLYLSEDTVKSHMRAVLCRLQAWDRAHAVRRGFELGLLTPDTQEATS